MDLHVCKKYTHLYLGSNFLFVKEQQKFILWIYLFFSTFSIILLVSGTNPKSLSDIYLFIVLYY